MSSFVVNPFTNRRIKIGGSSYNNLIAQHGPHVFKLPQQCQQLRGSGQYYIEGSGVDEEDNMSVSESVVPIPVNLGKNIKEKVKTSLNRKVPAKKDMDFLKQADSLQFLDSLLKMRIAILKLFSEDLFAKQIGEFMVKNREAILEQYDYLDNSKESKEDVVDVFSELIKKYLEKEIHREDRTANTMLTVRHKETAENLSTDIENILEEAEVSEKHKEEIIKKLISKLLHTVVVSEEQNSLPLFSAAKHASMFEGK